MTPAESMTAARQREVAAQQRLDVDRGTLETDRRVLADYEAEHADAVRQHAAAPPGRAAAAAESVRDAAEEVAAARRRVDARQRVVEAAVNELAAARKAIEDAVRDVIAAETPELYETFEAVRDQFLRLRSRLLAHYLVLPASLNAKQWREVDCRNIASAEEMGIGMVTIFRDTDWRSQRAAVTVYERALRDRMAQLERGEEAPATEKAAA